LRALMGKAGDVIKQAGGDGDVKAAIELLKAVRLYGEVGAPQGLTDPDAILQARAQAQARHELGDESPPEAALHGLNGGHHDRLKARAEELLTELREPFCNASDELSSNETQRA
jgi:hypothetical protein